MPDRRDMPRVCRCRDCLREAAALAAAVAELGTVVIPGAALIAPRDEILAGFVNCAAVASPAFADPLCVTLLPDGGFAVAPLAPRTPDARRRPAAV